MSEVKWLSGTSSGWMLEHAKRAPGLSSKARGRKFRLAAAAFVRELPGASSARGVMPVVDAVERLCDGFASLAEVEGLVRIAGYPPLSDEVPSWGSILWSLASPDGFSAAYSVTANTRWPNSSTAPGMSRDATKFVSVQAKIINDIFGNPFRPVAFDPSWRTTTAVGLARQVYEARDFAAMPILADALEDAGCADADVLAHCRGDGPHVRGCWVVDLVLGKS